VGSGDGGVECGAIARCEPPRASVAGREIRSAEKFVLVSLPTVELQQQRRLVRGPGEQHLELVSTVAGDETENLLIPPARYLDVGPTWIIDTTRRLIKRTRIASLSRGYAASGMGARVGVAGEFLAAHRHQG
jgi:hypothetical protein